MIGRPAPTRIAFLLLACGLAAAPGPATAQDDLEDVLGGFEEEDPAFAVEEQEPGGDRERWWDLSGSAELSGTFNYRRHESATGKDYFGLQRLRNRLNLQLDLDLPSAALEARGLPFRDWKLRLEGWGFADLAYILNERSNYTRQVLNAYEFDWDVGEAWLQGKLAPQVDLKLGRQVVIWGRSESLRVLDVLNPLDNREPGRVDIEDLRRPVGMLKLDAYLGDWSASFIAIPEIRFDEGPVVGSDFYPVAFQPRERTPTDFEDIELAAAVTGIFSGWDVSFHGAWFWNDRGRFRRGPFPAVLVHDRLWMVGSGGNYTTGSWLLKYEIAYVDGLGFFADSFFADSGKGRLDLLLGVEFYGIQNTTITLEGTERHLFGHHNGLLKGPDATRQDVQEIAFRITRNFYNERIQVTGLAVLFGWDGQDGAIARLDASLDLRDALTVGLGIVFYQEGDLPPFDRWSNNDRIVFNLKWSF